MFGRIGDALRSLNCCGILGASEPAAAQVHSDSPGAAPANLGARSRRSGSADSTTPLLGRNGSPRSPRASLPGSRATDNGPVAESSLPGDAPVGQVVSHVPELGSALADAMGADVRSQGDSPRPSEASIPGSHASSSGQRAEGVQSSVGSGRPQSVDQAETRETSEVRGTEATALPQIGRTELALAGYVLARALDGRALSDSSVDKLMVDSTVMKVTCDRFPHGRSNVVADNAWNGHENAHRGMVARTIAEDFMSGFPENVMSKDQLSEERHYTEGAAGALVGAGFCGEHAMNALVVLAPKLSPGERAHVVGSTTFNHVWAEHELASHPETTRPVGQSGADRSESPIVLDAWSDGPAMKGTDTRLGKNRGEVFYRNSISYEGRNTTAKAFDEKHQMLGREWGPKINTMIVEHRNKLGDWPQDHPYLWRSNPVVDPAFAQRSRDLIAHRDQDDVHRLAAGIAEKVFGLSAEAAALAAPLVVRAAANLDEIGPARGIGPSLPADAPGNTSGTAG